MDRETPTSVQPDMGERFGKSGFEPIHIGELVVHPMLRLEPNVGDTVDVEWIAAASPRPQGIVLRLRNPLIAGAKGRAGVLRYEGIETPSLALWMDTIPEPLPTTIAKLKPGAQLQVSNRWIMPDGRVDEWFMNYGMLIEMDSDGSYLLRCSDGAHVDGPAFDDLVVRVTVRPAGT